MLGRLLRRFRRRPGPQYIGVVIGDLVQPFSRDPQVPLSRRAGRRLRFGDEIAYEVSPRTGIARRVVVRNRAR
jgi:hypothetical protein